MSRSGLRRGLAWAAVVVALAYAVVAVQLYRARVDPEGARGAWDWVFGPTAEGLNDSARGHLQVGVEALDDDSRTPAERIGAYRDHLRAAEGLLVRSLRAQPAQAWALAKLAAIRWELDPPVSEEERARHVEMVRLASGMAPHDPAVQLELGQLLLMTGLRQDGAEYLRRAVELDPAMAGSVIGVLGTFFFSPEDMLAVLPRSPEVLAALRGPFFRSGSGDRYVALLDGEMASGTTDPAVIRAFSEAGMELDAEQRVVARLEGLGTLADPGQEAERSIQLAFAMVSTGSAAGAVETARRAVRLDPASDRYREQLGLVALRAGDAEAALTAFREALALAARAAAPARRRATLYRRVGQALDRLDRSDEAYDAYRMALRVNPGEPFAARRVQEMEAAAGFRRDRGAGAP